MKIIPFFRRWVMVGIESPPMAGAHKHGNFQAPGMPLFSALSTHSSHSDQVHIPSEITQQHCVIAPPPKPHIRMISPIAHQHTSTVFPPALLPPLKSNVLEHEILKEAGVSLGSLHSHFENKISGPARSQYP